MIPRPLFWELLLLIWNSLEIDSYPEHTQFGAAVVQFLCLCRYDHYIGLLPLVSSTQHAIIISPPAVLLVYQ